MQADICNKLHFMYLFSYKHHRSIKNILADIKKYMMTLVLVLIHKKKVCDRRKLTDKSVVEKRMKLNTNLLILS